MALKVYENMEFIGTSKAGNELFKHKLTNEVFELVPQLVKLSTIDEHVKSLLDGNNQGGMIKS